MRASIFRAELVLPSPGTLASDEGAATPRNLGLLTGAMSVPRGWSGPETKNKCDSGSRAGLATSDACNRGIRYMDMHSSRQSCFVLIAALVCLSIAFFARAGEPRVFKVEPASAMREAAKREVAIFGDGFTRGSIVKFLATRTNRSSGITATQVTFVNSHKLSVAIEIAREVEPGLYDVVVQDAAGNGNIAPGAFLVQPYSWADRFIGCTGAETWRLHRSCRRGSIN